MLVHIGPIPDTPGFVPNGAWKKLREPPPWVMQFCALPIGVASLFAVGFLWFYITPLREFSFNTPTPLVIAIIVIVPSHELIHAAVHPHFGWSKDSILGFWPKTLLFYAHYHGEISRNRFIAILMTPFLVISLLPLFTCAILSVSLSHAALISMLNALMSCGDMFAALLLFFQLPKNATARNQGYKTYWRVG